MQHFYSTMESGDTELLET